MRHSLRRLGARVAANAVVLALCASLQPLWAQEDYIRFPTVLAEALVPDPDDRAAHTHAAFLLVLANRLREPVEGAPEAHEMAPPEDLQRIGAPLAVLEAPLDEGQRWPLEDLDAELQRRAEGLRQGEQGLTPVVRATLQRQLLEELGEQPSRRSAALFAAAAVGGEEVHPLVDVAAAAALAEVLPQEEVDSRLVPLLGQYALLEEPVGLVAATVLARVRPDHEVLDQLASDVEEEPRDDQVESSLMVHGTFARNGAWWRPGGDFHGFLAGLLPDLYAGPDPYYWSGAWSHDGRLEGAERLRTWAQNHNADCLEIIAHSHGSNVAFVANDSGLRMGRLVLLSTPVWWRHYHPHDGLFESAISVRTKLDLVILADSGGQRFPDGSGIEELVLDIWYSHSASHDPEVWGAHSVGNALPVAVCP